MCVFFFKSSFNIHSSEFSQKHPPPSDAISMVHDNFNCLVTFVKDFRRFDLLRIYRIILSVSCLNFATKLDESLWK